MVVAASASAATAAAADEIEIVVGERGNFSGVAHAPTNSSRCATRFTVFVREVATSPAVYRVLQLSTSQLVAWLAVLPTCDAFGSWSRAR
jgi:hypothetical protein